MLYKYYSDKTIQNFVIHFATKSILNCPTQKNSLNFLKTKIIQFTLSHIKSFLLKNFTTSMIRHLQVTRMVS